MQPGLCVNIIDHEATGFHQAPLKTVGGEVDVFQAYRGPIAQTEISHWAEWFVPSVFLMEGGIISNLTAFSQDAFGKLL